MVPMVQSSSIEPDILSLPSAKSAQSVVSNVFILDFPYQIPTARDC